ncbi:tape measure protein [Loigolactobacillus coryniformis]|uniref:tape measure protein n=1 Tax=Loigolactobacillus coryniformis TaxID=1610 RepID=UPI003F21454F
MASAIGIVKVASAAFGMVKDSIGAAITRVDTLNNASRTFSNMGFSAKESKSAMDALTKSISGMPTSLDQAVSGVELLAGSTNDIGKSQEVFAALNDGIIGFGGSADNVNDAVRQLSQGFAAGKVDAETWNSMIDNGLGPALNAMAKQMGMTTADLKSGLSDGTVSVDQFQKSLIDLDKKGGGGLASLSKIAKDATNGIGTGFTNMKTAIVRGMANAITAFDKFLKHTTGSNIASWLGSIGAAFESTLNKVSVVLTAIEPAFTVFYNSLKQVIDFIRSNLSVFASLAAGVVAGIVAFKAVATIAAAAGIFSVVTKEVGLFIFAFNNVRKVKGVLTGLSVALKAVGVANPFGLLVAAVVGLIAVFATLYATNERFRNAVNSMATSAQAAFTKILPTVQSLWQSLKNLVSSGIEKLSPIFDSIGSSLSSFGGLASIAIGVLTRIGLIALGITGPLGLLAGAVISFIAAWARTGQLNTSGITQVFDNLNSAISNISGAISTYLPQIIAAGTRIIIGLAAGITAAIPQIVATASQIITAITQALTTVLPSLVSAGTQIITGIVTAIVTALPLLIQAGIQIITMLVSAIVTALPALISAGLQILSALIQGIVSVLPTLIQAGLQIITALITAIITVLPMLLQAGLQILMALVNGIVTMLPMLIQAGMQIILALVNAIVTALPQLIQAGLQILLVLVQGIISMLPVLIQAGLMIILALFNAIIANLPQIIQAGLQVLQALISGIIQVLPLIIQAALQIIQALFQALIANLPQILAAGVQLIMALVKGVLSIIGAVISAAVQIGAALLKAILNFVGQLLSAGAELIRSLISGILSLLGSAGSAAINVGTSILNAIISFIGRMLSAGVQLVGQVISGISNGIGKAGAAARSVAQSALSAVTGFGSRMLSAGKDFVSGFVNGIKGAIGDAADAAANMAKSAMNAAKKFLHIGSPSKVMKQIGAWTGEGFQIGIERMVSPVAESAQKLAKAAMFDVPELDAGQANLLNGLFGGQLTAEAALGLGANLAPTTTTTNYYNTDNSVSTTAAASNNKEAIELLKQIAAKHTTIDGSSFASSYEAYGSSETARRNQLSGRGIAIEHRI